MTRIGTNRSSRAKALTYFKFSLEAANHDVENCELLILDTHGDYDAAEVLRMVQAKYESVADELENAISEATVMCGRYYRKSDKQAIAKAIKTRNSLEDVVLPDFDYNIAPSTFQPIIRADAETAERTLFLMRWGLVPANIGDPDSFKIYTASNARSEGILNKPIWEGRFSIVAASSR
jgi:hypothetical protein